MKTFDFVVIGGGIAGASAAAELAAHGRVVLLEAENHPGYHSTGRSAALFTENYGNEIIRKLTIASRAFLEAPPECFSEVPLLSERGVLWIARPDQGETLAGLLGLASALVPSIRSATLAEARRICPVLREDYLGSSVLEPDAKDMDVHAIHRGYLDTFRRRKGELQTAAPAVGLHPNGRAWDVETPQGSFAAAVVVNAAGAWCDAVGGLAGADPVGLVPKRRTAVTFDAPAGTNVNDWPVVIDVDEQFYFKPEAGRVLASPADETPVAPCDVQPEELDMALAVARIEQATTLRVTRLAHKWAGLRSFVADKTPVIGMDSRLPGFFWLAGQGGYGIMTSPAMARAMAGLVIDGHLPADLVSMGLTPEQLSPARLQH